MELAAKMPNISYLDRLDTARNSTYEKLLTKMQSVKLNFLKQQLRERKISFNENINDFQELQEQVMKSMSPEIQTEIGQACLSFNTDIDETTLDLKNGSTTKFKELLEKLGEKVKDFFDEETFLAILESLAEFAKTPEAKIIVGVAIIGVKTFKGVKNSVKAAKQERKEAYDNILHDFETKKDENGNIIETEFPENIQNEIIAFLKERNIDVKDGDYDDLREKMYGLDNKTKRLLLNMVNDLKGNEINIDEEVKKHERTRIKRIKDEILDPILKDAFKALGISFIKDFIFPQSKEKQMMNNSLPLSAIAEIADSGLGEWTMSVAGKGAELTGQSEEEQIKSMTLSIMREYMNQEGMPVQNDGKTAEDFKQTISGLSPDEKRKVSDALKQLEIIKDSDNQTTISRLQKIAKTLLCADAIGLDGTDITDISKSGVIEEILGEENGIVVEENDKKSEFSAASPQTTSNGENYQVVPKQAPQDFER